MKVGIILLALLLAAVYVGAGIAYCRARYADYIEELENE